MGVAGSDVDHLDDEQKNITAMKADALNVLDRMTEIERQVVLAELDDLQAALDRMDAAVKSEAAQDTISAKSLGPGRHRLLMAPISRIAPSLQVLPEGNMTVTQCVSLPDRDPKLLEARKAMPNTVKVSEKEHRATQHQCSAPFPGFQDDKPLRKILADHFKKVC